MALHLYGHADRGLHAALHLFQLDQLTPAPDSRAHRDGRGAEPWEVANVIVFLASDYSSYMTGECVAVSSQRG